MYSDPEWRKQAKCLGVNPKVFYPPEGSNAHLFPITKYCINCPVREECLAQALVEWWSPGVLGGTAHKERDRVRQAAKRAVKSTKEEDWLPYAIELALWRSHLALDEGIVERKRPLKLPEGYDIGEYRRPVRYDYQASHG